MANLVALLAALEDQPSWQQGIADGDGARPAAAGYTQLADLVFDPWWRWLEDPRTGRTHRQARLLRS